MVRVPFIGLLLAVLGGASTALADPPLQPGADRLMIEISNDADDGTEVDGLRWHADGYAKTGRNRMGGAIETTVSPEGNFTVTIRLPVGGGPPDARVG